ncbi:MAG: fimbria/pilus outer membrane usher protein [bacterium]|nr:fimbria/pilus outer membrane usher protein [bacterium]
MRPYFIRSPGLEVSGVLETPSEVKVYVNDILTRSEKLGPGEFEFLNLSATGEGETTILIRDAYGREERIMTPFYISSRLLVPGLDEYSYNLGFKREDISVESFEYGELAFVGFHRRGLTKGITGGIRVEADKDTINLGPTATFVLGTIGEMDTALGASSVNGQYGYGGSLGLSLASLGGINPRLSLRGFSREYGDISTSQSMSRSRSEVVLGLGFRQRILGSISSNYSIQNRYEGTGQKRLSLFYSRKVLWDGSLSISANRRWENDEVEDEVFVGLNFFMGGGRTLNLNSKLEEDRTTIAASIAKNPPRGIGGGYRFQIEGDRETVIDEKTHLRGQAQLEWHGPYGIYSADYRGDPNLNSYDLKLAGGLAFIDGHLYPSRPINDGFALVKVDNLKGIKVKESNQEVGRTNRRGELLVPGLVSYYDNQLSLIPEDMPLNYNILETTRYVSLPYRGGGVVEFGVVKLQAFEGRLFFIEDGKKIPATYTELTIKIEEKTIETVVGKDGEFYLENLPPGRYLARLFKEGKEGSFEMIIPESNDFIVDMGEIICELPAFEEGLAATLRFTDILPTSGLEFPRQEPGYAGKRDLKMAVEVFSDTDCVKLYVHLKNAGKVSPFISLHNFTLLTKSGQSFPQSVFRTYATLNPFPTGLLRPSSKREGFIIFNTNDPPQTLIYKDRFGNEVLTNLP